MKIPSWLALKKSKTTAERVRNAEQSHAAAERDAQAARQAVADAEKRLRTERSQSAADHLQEARRVAQSTGDLLAVVAEELTEAKAALEAERRAAMTARRNELAAKCTPAAVAAIAKPLDEREFELWKQIVDVREERKQQAAEMRKNAFAAQALDTELGEEPRTGIYRDADGVTRTHGAPAHWSEVLTVPILSTAAVYVRLKKIRDVSHLLQAFVPLPTHRGDHEAAAEPRRAESGPDFDDEIEEDDYDEAADAAE